MNISEKYMRLAIQEARTNLKDIKGGPFGACIIKKNKVLLLSRNTVLENDATCHAEINAIYLVSFKLKTFNLSGCVIYFTTGPCPMCFGAITGQGLILLYTARRFPKPNSWVLMN